MKTFFIYLFCTLHDQFNIKIKLYFILILDYNKNTNKLDT